MTREIESHFFRILQRKQQSFFKVLIGAFAGSIMLGAFAIAFRIPLFLAFLPIGLVGPFAFNVITARCPRCARRLHRSIFGAMRPLTRCGRCGLTA